MRLIKTCHSSNNNKSENSDQEWESARHLHNDDWTCLSTLAFKNRTANLSTMIWRRYFSSAATGEFANALNNFRYWQVVEFFKAAYWFKHLNIRDYRQCQPNKLDLLPQFITLFILARIADAPASLFWGSRWGVKKTFLICNTKCMSTLTLSKKPIAKYSPRLLVTGRRSWLLSVTKHKKLSLPISAISYHHSVSVLC